MKKTITTLFLFAIFSNSYAQNDSIRKPLKCGTQIIEDEMERENQKIIEDFIAASEKDPMFGNGRWQNIGKQNTDEEILKAGFKNNDSITVISSVKSMILNVKLPIEVDSNTTINLIKSIDHGNYRYILFTYQKGEKFYYQTMALYNKTNFTFKTYDAFAYQNHYYPEVLGEWLSNKFFTKSSQTDFELIKAPKNLDLAITQNHNYRISINEDYTFEILDIPFCSKDCFPKIKGKYYFSADGKINFDCYLFYECSKTCSTVEKHKYPFVSGPFNYKIENDALILKK